MRLEDLPERYRLQVLAQTAQRAIQEAAKNTPKTARKRLGIRLQGSATQSVSRGKFRGSMNSTEAKYNRECLDGRGRYEVLTLRLAGGSRYTPDFLTVCDGVVTLHEVKGAYRFPSEGRARTAFRECAAQFPMFRFIWAKWTGKTWKIEELTGAPIYREKEKYEQH